MSEKSKRKPTKESPWQYPKLFRYEVKGELHHLIGAIQSLHQEEKQGREYLVTIEQPLDEEALYTFEVVYTSYDRKGNTKVKLQGDIQQNDAKFIVEGFALVDLRSHDSEGIIAVVSLIFILIVLAGSPDGLKVGAWFGVMFLILLGMLFMSHLQERDTLIEHLLTGLQTYTPPVSHIAQTGPETEIHIAIQNADS